MILRLAMAVILVAAMGGAGTAQAADSTPDRSALAAGAGEAPERSVAAHQALEAAQWEETEEGFEVMRARTGAGASLVALRIPPERFVFAIAVQTGDKGERVDAFGEREGALIAINGGFFGEDEESKRLFPVGLLRVGGKDFSPAWNLMGGVAVIKDGRLSLRPSSAGVPEATGNVLQSKPMLIEPGGKWAMNTNQGHLRPRSLLCTLKSGETLILVVKGAGLSLYEAGWLMREASAGGYFGCDAALALDGGGSTQLWIAGHEDLSFAGETPVHNALIVKRRGAE
ncbi:MAG: phosphodiester glycosidase family protein [Salaquimonas sp.]|jgi:exopolysaccharide biosynthesis protein|nr:phosphodiester glycosidase family protein [Salaquimonas sp.]